MRRQLRGWRELMLQVAGRALAEGEWRNEDPFADHRMEKIRPVECMPLSSKENRGW